MIVAPRMGSSRTLLAYILAAAVVYAGLQQVWVHLQFRAPAAQSGSLATIVLDTAFVLVYLATAFVAGLASDRWIATTLVVVGGSIVSGAVLGGIAGYVLQRERMFPDVGFFAQLLHVVPLLVAFAAAAAIVGLVPAWLTHRLVAATKAQ
jgi:hypothetical protein